MKRPNDLESITSLMEPYFEESALAGDRTKIWVPQDVYDAYKDILLEFWDVINPGVPVDSAGPVTYRGMELVVREDVSHETPSK